MEKIVNAPFVKAFLKAMLNYMNFKERTSRPDFWWYFVATAIISVLTALIGKLLGNASIILNTVMFLVLLLPTLSIMWRRMHDIGRSGLWNLLILTVIGVIPVIIWWAKPGDDGDNAYGFDPTSNYGY